ncbi:MAG: hypothetical protein ABEJ31_15030 [Haloarculaceae archaeon]
MTDASVGRLGVGSRPNAIAGWLLAGTAGLAVLANLAAGRLLDAGFGVLVVALSVAPAVALRRRDAVPPWEVIGVAAVPVLASALSIGGLTGAFDLGVYLAVAALSVLLAVDLDLLSTVELTDRFAVFFVATTTLATAALWALVRWFVGLALGVAFPETLHQLMIELVGAAAAGLLGGLAFAGYVHRSDRHRRRLPDAVVTPGDRPTGRLGRSPARPGGTGEGSSSAWPEGRFLGLSPTRQRQATRALQVGLAAIVALGLLERDTGVVVNAGIGLGATFVPAILNRDYDVPLDVRLTLWITLAVFAHAVGTVRFPGSPADVYQRVWWWDHLTHLLSASVVAVVGYAVARAIDANAEALELPPRFLFVFLLVLTLAFGALWEILEFSISAGSRLVGTTSVLTQYGLADTMNDLLFDALGGLLVAVAGTAYLSDFTERLAAWWAERPRE